MTGFMKLAYVCIFLAMASAWYVPEDPSATDLLSTAAIGFTFVSFRFYQPELRAFYFWAFVFLAANLVSTFFAHDPGHAFFSIAKVAFLYLTLIVFASVAANLPTIYISKLYSAIIFSALIAGILGVLAFFRFLPGPVEWYFRSNDGVRLAPFFQDPNVYGPFLCLGVAITLTLFWDSKKVPLALLLLPVMFLPLLLSFSRGAWLNMAVTLLAFACFTFLFQKDRQVTKRFLLTGLVMFIGMIVAFPIVVDAIGVGDFLQSRSRIQAYDSVRFGAQFTAIELSMENPLGIGPGHYVGRNTFPNSHFHLDAHNLFLNVLVERGWLGFISFSAFIIFVVKVGFETIIRHPQRSKYSIALLASFTGLLANSMFITSLHWRHMFVIIGLIFAEYVIYKRHQKKLIGLNLAGL